MLDMSATNNASYPVSTTSAVFEVGDTCYVLFSVSGLTAGQVTFQYNPNNGADWYTIDGTELVLTADALKFAVLGACQVRASFDGSVASSGNNLFIGIQGNTVSRRS
jgi:hypothetical protein